MSRKRKFKVIAIDGPAGSGKSTTARLVAKKLGFLYLDTGAMYRALTYKILREKTDPNSKNSVERVCRNTKLRIETKGGGCQIYLEGRNVTTRLRAKSVERNVSAISAYPEVRKRMVRLQRKIASRGNLVIEGRDTTTVVFPDADLKIYLKASLEERAKRKIKGPRLTKVLLAGEKKELSQRDQRDTAREIAPLKKARDSIAIDTTNLSLSQQVEKVLALYRQKVKQQ